MDINTITYPSRVSGLTSREYHSSEAWSKSGLDKVHRSPAHFFSEKKEETPALVFGRAVHSAVIEPDKFPTEFTVAPKVDRRTNAGKAEWAAFEFDCARLGKEIISLDDMTTIQGMCNAINAHPIAKHIFKDGLAEQSFFWIDPVTGLKCRCRTDFYRKDGTVIDLKSTASCDRHDFERSMAIYRYHVQAAYYIDGIFKVGDFSELDAPTDFVLVAIEKEPPYGLRIYRVDDRSIEFGRIAYRNDLLTVADFYGKPERVEELKSIVYPDSIEISEISLPAWAE